MGLFKKRKQPMPVGQAFCMVGEHGKAYVYQQHHENMQPEAVALLAATTWVLDGAVDAYSRHPDAYALWMSFAFEAWHPTEFNDHHNPGGVHHLQPDQLSSGEGVAVRGEFSILPTSKLTGTWTMGGGLVGADHQLRVLGALTAAVDNIGSIIEYAWAVSSLHSMVVQGMLDLRARDLGAYLPQMLMDDGARFAIDPGGLPG